MNQIQFQNLIVTSIRTTIHEFKKFSSAIKLRKIIENSQILLFSIFLITMSLCLYYSTHVDRPVVWALNSSQGFANGSNILENNFGDKKSDTKSEETKNIAINTSNNQSQIKNEKPRVITLVTEDAYIDIAPGKRVEAWTYNGTVPGPTIRLTEGENITIKYINKSPIPHTIHFHGNHDDLNDGVTPQIMPNQTYLYNITAEPAGALMYHCHAAPTSMHIRMGMYGALIVDPINKPVKPAKEFVMVMGEYSLKNQLGFDADYYYINGYANQYVNNPLVINHGDLMRIYLINLGTTIPASFHLHSTTFLAYPSGLWDNNPIHAQTVSVAPGDASIVEAKWKYPGTYFFHAHGIQEEKGNMGQIKVIEDSEQPAGNESIILNDSPTKDFVETDKGNTTVTNGSESMFDWQYDLQKKLQNPQIIDNRYQAEKSDTKDNLQKEQNHIVNNLFDKNITFGSGESLSKKNTSLNNNQDEEIKRLDYKVQSNESMDNDKNNILKISIVPNASSPESQISYNPSNLKIKLGQEIEWVNDDSGMPHTVTSGNSDSGPSGVFDSGILSGGDKSSFIHKFEANGEFDYYCTLHPWMKGKIIVTD